MCNCLLLSCLVNYEEIWPISPTRILIFVVILKNTFCGWIPFINQNDESHVHILLFKKKKPIHFPSQGQETKPKYQEMMSALDENKNDKIDFEDFMVHVVSLTLMSDLRQEIQNVQKSK